MDARTIELNRIDDLLKNAFDGRYKNSLLSTHQKPVSVVPNRDFALKQFEFAKIAKKLILQTLVQKPADLDLYWSESTINLIRKLVKEREQYKQNLELVNAQLNNKSSDAANNKEIVKLKQELQTFETMKKMNEEMNNMMSQLNYDNNKLKMKNEELQKSNDAFKEIIDKNAIEKFKIDNANGKLLTELKECNKNLNNCKEDLGKCNEDNNDMKVKIYDCNVEKQNANEEANVAAEWTQQEVEKNDNLTKQLQQKNVENKQLQQNLQTAENKFKLEKAQMDIMFGMKMDLIKKHHEQNIANISNSSNADLIKQNNNLITEKQTYQQGYKQTIDDFNETIRKNKEDIERLKDENAKLSSETQKQETEKLLNETQKQAMSSQANTDKAKIAQLQTRVIKLTQELLIIKMNEDLRSKKNAIFKPTKPAAPAVPTKLDRTTFVKREFVGINMGINMKGGAPKQKLFMKGGASKDFSIEFNDTEEILVIFNKHDKSLIQTPNDPEMTYCTVEMITEYNNKLKELKDNIDALEKLLPTPPVATPDSDAMNKLTAKLISFQTLYKDSQNNLRSEQIKNALNSSIQSTLNSSLTNSNVITDLTKENNNLKAENAVLKTENNNLKTENAGLTKEKAALEDAKTALEGAKTTLESANTALEGAKTILEREKTSLTGENSNLKSENANLTSANQTLTSENTNLTNENTNLTNENSGLKTTNSDLTTRLNSTSTSLGMSTAISTANATLREIPKGFISDNGRVMFSEHK